jgi:hypothetical protein
MFGGRESRLRMGCPSGRDPSGAREQVVA